LSEVMQKGRLSPVQAIGQITQALQKAKAAVSQVDSRIATCGGTSQRNAQGSSNQGSGESGNQDSKSAGSSQQGMQGSSVKGQGGSESGTGQSENGGGGAGEGSTNKDAGYTGSEGSGAGRKPGDWKEEDYERLYDPESLGGGNTPDMVSGQKQDGGQSRYTQVDNMPVQKGEVLPYREVLARYKDEAVSYMEDTFIPAAMKQIVREYFESLE
jgi:hypothetical protein